MSKRVFEFIETTPTLENYLRGIVLFGKNVASYKFALARSLIELGAAGIEEVSLETLANPFSRALCEHLLTTPRQTTSSASGFLDACRQFNEGEITHDQLIAITRARGFNNVIDAFHVVGNQDIAVRFFVDERKTRVKGIRLTEEIVTLAETAPDQSLAEIEARWRLVETGWSLGLANRLIEFDASTGLLVPSNIRRTPLASARDSLYGYQKGKCFYCFRPISSLSSGPNASDVDHVFPFVLMKRGLTSDLDQIWNLVLTCVECNRGANGKFEAIPAPKYISRLAKRNEYLIESNLPIKETLIRQTGANSEIRKSFLQEKLTLAQTSIPRTWQIEEIGEPSF